MRHARLLLFPLAIATAVATDAASADPPYDRVAAIYIDPGRTVNGITSPAGIETILFMIHRPSNMTGASKAYTKAQVDVRPGDSVKIEIGGCMPGGHTRFGATIAVADYTGSVEIPGAFEGVRSLSDVVGKWLPVGESHSATTPATTLRLLRMPNDFSLPCRLPPTTDASLTVFVRRDASFRPPTSTPPPRPMDLVSDRRDSNDLLSNPVWGASRTGPHPDPTRLCRSTGLTDLVHGDCSSQLRTSDTEAGDVKDVASIFGLCPGYHANWFPATFDGTVKWHSFDGGYVEDKDYNIEITTDGGAGLTQGNDWLKGEFDSEETVDHFGSRWWTLFRDRDDAFKRGMIDGSRVVVTGLVGFDMVHDASPEIHPVHVLAIRINDDPNEERWAFFARNWGNEGMCSHLQHLLPRNDVTFELKRPGYVPSAYLAGESELRGTPGSSISWAPSPGVIRVTAHLDGARPFVEGVLSFRWAPDPSVGVRPHVEPPRLRVGSAERTPAAGQMRAPVPRSFEREDHEEAIEEYTKRMTPSQRTTFRAQLNASRPARRTLITPTITRAAAPPHAAAGPVQYRTAPDTDAARRHERVRSALCVAFGGNVPPVKVGTRENRVRCTAR